MRPTTMPELFTARGAIEPGSPIDSRVHGPLSARDHRHGTGPSIDAANRPLSLITTVWELSWAVCGRADACQASPSRSQTQARTRLSPIEAPLMHVPSRVTPLANEAESSFKTPRPRMPV